MRGVQQLSYFDLQSETIVQSIAHSYSINDKVDIAFQQDDTVMLYYNFDNLEERQVTTDEVTVDFIVFCINTTDDNYDELNSLY